MDLAHWVCLITHRKHREVLIPGVLPWGIDAVVFCWRCDRFRGRAVRVFQPLGSRA
jgi:hypothetical protein